MPSLIAVAIGFGLLLTLTGYALSQYVMLPGREYNNLLLMWSTVLAMILASLLALVAVITAVNLR